MEKINKLSLPITILVGCVILGGFYYASQISKQNSIKQQNSFNNCMRSYSGEMEESLNEIFRLSPVDLCNKDYNYSSFINLARETKKDAERLFADPNDDLIKNDWSNLIRERLGLPELKKLD